MDIKIVEKGGFLGILETNPSVIWLVLRKRFDKPGSPSQAVPWITLLTLFLAKKKGFLPDS
jgi:hypothetical protein